MILGVTGTRKGLTEEQDRTVKGFLVGMHAAKQLDRVVHGCCIGADARIHELCVGAPLSIPIDIYPPINTRYMANLSGESHRFEPDEYMKRNTYIVDSSEIVLAMPDGMTEKVRSGTWACVRYAMRNGVTVVFTYPDGSIVIEDPSA